MPVVTRISIALTWLVRLDFIVFGFVAWVVAMPWIFLGSRSPVDRRLLAPFLAYQHLIQALLGGRGGLVVSHVVLLLLLLPATLWITMSLISFAAYCFASTRVLVAQPHENSRIRPILLEVCNEANVAAPRLAIDHTSVFWPRTTLTIPSLRCTVLHISSPIVEEMTDAELRVLLAHELAHTSLHLRRLWLAQMISRMSFGGPGYLTLLMNWWRMELEADAFAVEKTGDAESLKNLLEKSDLIELRAALRQTDPDGLPIADIAETPETSTRAGPGASVRELYTCYFGDNSTMWGYFHPSPSERLANLTAEERHHSEQGDVELIVVRSQVAIEDTVAGLIRGSGSLSGIARQSLNAAMESSKLSRRMIAVLVRADHEAREHNHDLGIADLFIGLLSDDRGTVSRVLVGQLRCSSPYSHAARSQ